MGFSLTGSITLGFAYRLIGLFAPRALSAPLHLEMMMSPKKLVKKLAATRSASSSRSSVANRGHFLAYTTDCERFVLPLAYLSNPIFQALLQVCEEEYGLPGNGPIVVSCDGVCMEYLVCLMQRSLSEDLERALVESISSARCLTSSFAQQELTQQLLVFSCS